LNSHGPDGLAFYMEHYPATETFTNLATGRRVVVKESVDKDLHVTDNGDGTVTVV
jgi:hypothetical protein